MIKTSNRRVSRLIISAGLVATSTIACQTERAPEMGTQGAQSATPVIAKATAQTPAVGATGRGATSQALLKELTTPSKKANTKEGESYNVHLPQAAQAQLKIEAKLGFKINENYPHRATFKVGGKAIEGDVVKEKHRLTFSSAKADVTQLGTSVEVSFSVCNDQMCKLYNEQYQW